MEHNVCVGGGGGMGLTGLPLHILPGRFEPPGGSHPSGLQPDQKCYLKFIKGIIMV